MRETCFLQTWTTRRAPTRVGVLPFVLLGAVSLVVMAPRLTRAQVERPPRPPIVRQKELRDLDERDFERKLRMQESIDRSMEKVGPTTVAPIYAVMEKVAIEITRRV